jgi:hypothetical protein
MKKIYTLILLISSLALIKSQTVPTCSLDPVFIAATKNGIWPDSATNFISGTVGLPYVQNITVKVPKDTIQSIIKFCFTRFELSTPSVAVNYNLPPGLNFGSSTPVVLNGTVNGAPSLKFPGNANNCASIYGTPTTAGTYTLKLLVDAYATSTTLLGNCPNTPTVTAGLKINTSTLGYYIITILPPAGINEQLTVKNFNLQNSPNPFNHSTSIKFQVQDEAPYKFSVYNILGKEVYSESKKTRIGENTIEFNGSNLNEGVYFYTITYKNYSETKRMILSTH